jgi:hypothetical protein
MANRSTHGAGEVSERRSKSTMACFMSSDAIAMCSTPSGIAKSPVLLSHAVEFHAHDELAPAPKSI